MRLLLLAIFISPLIVFAQPATSPVITKTKERLYKLVQLPNGDLVPFVKQGVGNVDTYFANNRPIKTVEFNSMEVPQKTSAYSYFGDSLVVVKTFGKDEKLVEIDSSWYAQKNMVRNINYRYRISDVVVRTKVQTIVDSVSSKIVIHETGKMDRVIHIKKMGNNTYVNTEIDADGKIISVDTITHSSAAGGRKTKTTFVSGSKLHYTIHEYEMDAYKNWTSRMVFYNKDTVGDHIECVLRNIIYNNDSSIAPFSKQSLYGYWVMNDGMRYWYFKANGEVEVYRRPYADTFYTKKWGFDDIKKQAYIILDDKELQALHDPHIIGNRLYLTYDAATHWITGGDITLSKRPSLKRVQE